MKTKEVKQFIRMLDTYSDDKYTEIRMAAGDHLGSGIFAWRRAENLENACLPGESNYISYILHWYKKHEIIPIILLPDAAEPNMMVEWEKEYTTRTMKRKPSKKLLAAWAKLAGDIDNDMKNFKNECEKVRVQIGLNFLGDSHFAQCNSRPRFWKKHGFCWSPLHYKNKKYLVFDNPCAAGAVMNAIAIPLGFLKKCLVLDFIPS